MNSKPEKIECLWRTSADEPCPLGDRKAEHRFQTSLTAVIVVLLIGNVLANGIMQRHHAREHEAQRQQLHDMQSRFVQAMSVTPAEVLTRVSNSLEVTPADVLERVRSLEAKIDQRVPEPFE